MVWHSERIQVVYGKTNCGSGTEWGYPEKIKVIYGKIKDGLGTNMDGMGGGGSEEIESVLL